MEAVFLGLALKFLLDTPSVWTVHTKNQTRVPAQEVHISLSDCWTVLKFLHEFLEVVSLGVALKLLLDTNTVWSGKTKDYKRVPAQELHNS
jgi:hypothetical protein